MSGERGRGSRFATGDCPDCGERCAADDRSLDAHRMWATRHANATGHTAHAKHRADLAEQQAREDEAEDRRYRIAMREWK